MLKHRGFPGRLPSTDHQFVIRRASPKGATKLVARERYRDRSSGDRRAALEGLMAGEAARRADAAWSTPSR